VNILCPNFAHCETVKLLSMANIFLLELSIALSICIFIIKFYVNVQNKIVERKKDCHYYCVHIDRIIKSVPLKSNSDSVASLN